MNRTWAVCQIDGLIKLVDEPPAEGHFALAVGELSSVREVIRSTAEPAPAPHGKQGHRVPGITLNAAERVNLLTIARYIQVLNTHNGPGFRALGA